MELIKRYKVFSVSVLMAFTPVIVLAVTTINSAVTTIGNIFDLVVPILMVVASVVFIWGIISYILAAGSDDRKKEAKNLIIWGLVALFVIVAMWGLVQILGKTFGVESTGIPNAPGGITF